MLIGYFAHFPYRESIDAYTEGLKLEPQNLPLLRLRAGRYLTTLECDLAIADFEICLSLGAEKPWIVSTGLGWPITTPDDTNRQ